MKKLTKVTECEGPWFYTYDYTDIGKNAEGENVDALSTMPAFPEGLKIRTKVTWEIQYDEEVLHEAIANHRNLIEEQRSLHKRIKDARAVGVNTEHNQLQAVISKIEELKHSVSKLEHLLETGEWSWK